MIADLIPVDLPVNMMITAAWYTAVSGPQQNAKIYHSTTGGLNPFTWGEMEGVIMRSIKRNPFESCFRRPKCTLTKHKFVCPRLPLNCQTTFAVTSRSINRLRGFFVSSYEVLTKLSSFIDHPRRIALRIANVIITRSQFHARILGIGVSHDPCVRSGHGLQTDGPKTKVSTPQ